MSVRVAISMIVSMTVAFLEVGGDGSCAFDSETNRRQGRVDSVLRGDDVTAAQEQIVTVVDPGVFVYNGVLDVVTSAGGTLHNHR